MAHRYGDPVQVQVDAATGAPLTFTWRGLTYAPLTVIATWHLIDRWWEGSLARQASNRQYYRVQLPDLQVFELYCDAGGGWVLDVVQD